MSGTETDWRGFGEIKNIIWGKLNLNPLAGFKGSFGNLDLTLKGRPAPSSFLRFEAFRLRELT